MQPRDCPRSELAHVRKFVAYAKQLINDAWYYPPSGGYRYIVALALYSKYLTVAEATMVLIDAGYNDEAFGMTRTLVDTFITLRYIDNKDTDERAKQYAHFLAKDMAVWSEVVRDYYPQAARDISPDMRRLATAYPSPHSWSGKNFKDMALEVDTHDIDPATGKPVSYEFTYRAIYRWTSHYVHPTIPALGSHLVQSGHDNFVVNGGEMSNVKNLALFNIACYLCFSVNSFYRCMKEEPPKLLNTWGQALLKHLGKRHP
jgi:hypothetical protein